MNRDQEAQFEAFVAGSYRALMHTAVLLVGDAGHAEDLCQVALERTARRWGSLNGAPEAYARVVLARLAVDRWRSGRRRAAEVLGEVPDRGHHDIAGQVSSEQDLITALSLLPPRQRAVLVLRYLDDLTEAQTAQALGISLGTVKSTAHRATATLRRLCPGLSTTPTPEGTHP